MGTATLSLERSFDAPRDAVCAAWTDPEVLRRWWAAGPDWDTPVAEVDLRVGGGYRLAMHDPGSDDTSRTSSPGSAGSVVTVVFRDDGPRTTVQLTHTGFADAAAVARHEHGWQAVMDSLERRVLTPQRA